MMMMTQMMTIVTMKNCNHQLMRWTLSFSLWTRSKARETTFAIIQKNNLRLISSCHLTSYFCLFGSLESAMQASDPLRFQNLTQTLDFHFQALANGVAEHAEQRRVVIEKEKLEKASTAGAS